MTSHRRFPRRNTGLDQGSRRRSHRPTDHGHKSHEALDHEEPPATDPFPQRREAGGHDARVPMPSHQKDGFVRCWTGSLDPVVRHWLHASIQREAIERSGSDPDESVLASAIDVLVEACADAQGVRIAELRLLVPSIDIECAEYVLSILRWDLQQAATRRSGSAGRLGPGHRSGREDPGDRRTG